MLCTIHGLDTSRKSMRDYSTTKLLQVNQRFINGGSYQSRKMRCASSQHDSEIVLNFFHSFGLRDDEFVQGIDIGFRAGNDDIGIRAVAAINARVLHHALRIHWGVTVRALNADSDFAERIDTSSNRVHIELK